MSEGPRGIGHRKVSKTNRSDPKILARRKLTIGSLAPEVQCSSITSNIYNNTGTGGIPGRDSTSGPGTNFCGDDESENLNTNDHTNSNSIISRLRDIKGADGLNTDHRNSKNDLTNSTDANGNTNNNNITISKIKKSLDEWKLNFLCRAYSVENKDGYHENEDRFFCEEHLVKNRGDGTSAFADVLERQKMSSSTNSNTNSSNSNGYPSFLPKKEIDLFTTGVMDGHDGSTASDLVAEKLPSLVINNCCGSNTNSITSTSTKSHNDTPHTSHVKALEQIENILKKKPGCTAGCCVNSIICWGKYLFCSNLGDCRALFVALDYWDSNNEGDNLANSNSIGGTTTTTGSTSRSPSKGHSTNTRSLSAPQNPQIIKTSPFIWLSRDMRASKPYEIVRMRSKGYSDGGSSKSKSNAGLQQGRIEGVLEPSRSIGDLDLKAELPDDIISITPESRYCDIVECCRKAEDCQSSNNYNNMTNNNNYTGANLSNNINFTKSQTVTSSSSTSDNSPGNINTNTTTSPTTTTTNFGLHQGCLTGLILQGTDGLWDGLTGDEILTILQKPHISKELRALQKYIDIGVREGKFDCENGEMLAKMEVLLEELVNASVDKPECSDDTTLVLSLVCLHERGKLYNNNRDKNGNNNNNNNNVKGVNNINTKTFGTVTTNSGTSSTTSASSSMANVLLPTLRTASKEAQNNGGKKK